MESKLIQQGDVLIFTNATLPADAKAVQPVHGRVVLAEGEVTGHAHVADLMRFPGTALFESPSGRFLQALTDIEIVHEEHKTVRVPKGIHQIRIVKEVDPFTEEIRSVKD